MVILLLVNTRLDAVEGVLAVLNEGSARGTNKYGLLLALIELAPVIGDGNSLSVEQISEKLLELHWDHAREFNNAPLRQLNSGNRQNTTVVLEAISLQQSLRKACSFEQASRTIAGRQWAESIRKIAFDAWRNPIRLLQNLPGSPPNFLYDIEDDRPRRIRLFEESLDALVRYGEVLRELIEFKFVRFVAEANKPSTGGSFEEDVAEFLFGTTRQMPPKSVRRDLWELQGRRCLYTGAAIADPTSDSSGSSVDHVIPWKRTRLSAVENFVITTKQVNSSKSALLLAPILVARWAKYLIEEQSPMGAIALRNGWCSDLARVVAVALAQYRHATPATPVWDPEVGVRVLGTEGRRDAVEALESLINRFPAR